MLLTELLTQPRSLDEILEAFSAKETGDFNQELADQMRQMLAHLEDLGLVERA